jgi:hypothetical protein
LYTSDAHIWKGIAVILNKKPTTINKIRIKIPLEIYQALEFGDLVCP